MSKKFYYYIHAYARGVDKRKVFLDNLDCVRFFFTLTLSLRHFAPSPARFHELIKNQIVKPKDFKVAKLNRLYGTPQVEVLSAVLMPNHFHLHLRFHTPSHYSSLLQRLIGGYTKYFNTRYNREGRLFSSKTKTVSIITDDQNIYLTKYIHLNPLTSSQHLANPETLAKYRWSTYPLYLNQAPQFTLKDTFIFDASYFCNPQPILSQFQSITNYKNFVLQDDGIDEALNNKQLIDPPK